MDDLVKGKIRVMNENHIGPINIGNPGEFTIRQLAELVHGKVKLPQDVPLQLHPVIELVQRRQLGCQPRISLEQGLDVIIDYFS